MGHVLQPAAQSQESHDFLGVSDAKAEVIIVHRFGFGALLFQEKLGREWFVIGCIEHAFFAHFDASLRWLYDRDLSRSQYLFVPLYPQYQFTLLLLLLSGLINSITDGLYWNPGCLLARTGPIFMFAREYLGAGQTIRCADILAFRIANQARSRVCQKLGLPQQDRLKGYGGSSGTVSFGLSDLPPQPATNITSRKESITTLRKTALCVPASSYTKGAGRCE